MKIKNIYEISTLSRYYNEYNVSKEELAKNNVTYTGGVDDENRTGDIIESDSE